MTETQTNQPHPTASQRLRIRRYARDVHEEENEPNHQLRRRVAATIAGLIIAPFVAKGFADSHDKYGYHPTHHDNTPAETRDN